MMFVRLFFEFFRIGLLSVGGGMATVPFLVDLGQRTNWFTSLDIANMIAVSESTPGPIGINMATYVGYTCNGVLGALTSTIGLVTPSVIVILIISFFLEKFSESKAVKCVFRILRASVVGLLSFALFTVARIAITDIKSIILFAVLFAMALLLRKKHPILIIAMGALLGIIFI